MVGLKKTQLHADVDAMKKDDMAGETTDNESESVEELMLSEPSKNPVRNRGKVFLIILET